MSRFFDGVQQKCFGLCVFRQQQKAACTGVQPVAQVRKTAARQAALFIQAAQHAGVQCVGRFALHRDTGRFVYDQEVVVFIDDVGRGAGGQEGGACGRGKPELLIGQKQADGVAVLHAGRKRLLFAV